MFLLVWTLFNFLAAPANPWIAPGRRLGNVTLGAPPATLTALGPPATGDAAMQKAWATWYGGTAGHRTQLDVYTAVEGPAMQETIQVIRTTSPFFHTAEGLRSGSSLSTVRQACGPLTLAGSYRLTSGAAPRYLYDNVRAGIAFETDGTTATSHCTAVLVHLPGKAIRTSYSSLFDYLQQLQGR